MAKLGLVQWLVVKMTSDCGFGSCRYNICCFFRCRHYKMNDMNALSANAGCFRDTSHPGRHISLVYLWKCIKNTLFW